MPCICIYRKIQESNYVCVFMFAFDCCSPSVGYNSGTIIGSEIKLVRVLFAGFFINGLCFLKRFRVQLYFGQFFDGRLFDGSSRHLVFKF